MPDQPAYIPPSYQGQAWPDTFTTQPFASDFEARKQAFFEQVLRNPAPPRGSKRAMFEVARLAAGGQPNESVIHESITEYVESRKDCADFVMQAVIRLLYQFGGKTEDREPTEDRRPFDGTQGRPMTDTPGFLSSIPGHSSTLFFSAELLRHAKSATLGFKYWPDEPGVDSMCSWTENHQILFSATAYLAGQLYPDEVFANSGRTGREMMAVHRPRIDCWLEMRFKSGFSEWLSNVYYDEDWAPLLNLVDFAEDEELRQRARMVIDISLFDMALNSFEGIFGSTHGRSYEQNKKWPALEGTTDVAKLLFGTGAFSAYDNMSVALFAMSENYHLPQVLFDIANDDTVVENRQRMGHRIRDAKLWGLTYNDIESGMVFLSNEAYLHPKNANLTLKLFDAFNWWENDFFSNFKAYRGLLQSLRRLKLLPALARLIEKDVCRNMREEANIYTYRTPNYTLSTAQDYRPGYGGDQHHIWQATLGPNAVCFTTHPVLRSAGTPNYWTGSGTLPRVAQVKNVVIAIYKISRIPGLYVTNNLFYTHAWLPKAQFDETVECAGWILARKGEGYLALHSQTPYQWVQDLSLGSEEMDEAIAPARSDETSPLADSPNEVIANSRNNIWVCELGRQEDDGDFAQFIEKICQAKIHFDGLSIRYQSPSQGWLEFDWKGALKKDGQVIPLNDYARYDNPYCQTAFLSDRIVIKSNRHQLVLDWQDLERVLVE
jgi:hypothetical protein